VIYGGVDVERFCPGKHKELGTVLFVGRLLPHKGVDCLIRALPDGARLRIVGRPYSAEYYAGLEQLARGKNVEFLTDVKDADLPAHYRQAQVLALPSVTSFGGVEDPKAELFGLALVEAMASGTAVVGSDTCSIPEIVSHGECGLLVPPGDADALRAALGEILDSPSEARRMGQAGRARAELHFTWPSVARRCQQAYLEM
jgi:glycosyltransferase involved in cell wall biosynthesis